MRILRRPDTWSRKAAAIGIVMVGALVLTRLSCAPHHDASVRTPHSAQTDLDSSSDVEEAPPSRGNIEIPDAPTPSLSPLGDRTLAHTPAPTPSPTHDVTPAQDAQQRPTTARRLPHGDVRELSLLANIERELKRDPPPEVHSLLAEYRGGAHRALLIEYVQRVFPKDLPLRVIALRWIDDVRPGDAEPASAPRVSVDGADLGWVKPVRQRR